MLSWPSSPRRRNRRPKERRTADMKIRTRVKSGIVEFNPTMNNA
jgi:hypothetical protein